MSRMWLYIDSAHGDFDSTTGTAAKRLVGNDPHFGTSPLTVAQ